MTAPRYSSRKIFFIYLAFAQILLLTGCNGESISNDTYSISGMVEGEVEDGVTINITGQDITGYTTTNTTGGFSFSGLPEGAYSLTPSLSGYTFTPSYHLVTINNADVIDIAFTSAESTE